MSYQGIGLACWWSGLGESLREKTCGVWESEGKGTEGVNRKERKSRGRKEKGKETKNDRGLGGGLAGKALPHMKT